MISSFIELKNYRNISIIIFVNELQIIISATRTQIIFKTINIFDYQTNT